MPDDRNETGNLNYLKEAFKWQYNVIGLAGAAAFALVSGTALPLILAAGVELMYLAVVPQSSAFRRLVRSWKFEEEKKAQDARVRAMHMQLTPMVRARFEKLQEICKVIRGNYARLSSTSQIFVDQMSNRLDGLLNSFLRLANAGIMYTEYLHKANPRAIDQEIATLEREIPKQPAKVQEINRKRIEIMRKRQERFRKIVDDLQMVSEKLDGLIADVETTEATVREIEDFFAIAESEGISPMASGTSGLESNGGQRDRTR
jgi:signal transduction histidine kinase